MLSTLLRPRKGRRPSARSPFSSPFNSSPFPARNAAVPDTGEFEQDDDHVQHVGDAYDEDEHDYNEEDLEEDDDDAPLLPIFSAAYLGGYKGVQTI